MQPLSFFIERINKRVFRDSDGCSCDDCDEISMNGLIIRDEEHAQYIYDIQCDFGAEGIELNYRELSNPSNSMGLDKLRPIINYNATTRNTTV